MKGLFRRVLAVFAVLLLLFLVGCDSVELNEELLSPPRPQGELYEVQQALYKTAPAGMKLRYPQKGQYRSAVTSFDIDGDGKNEAIAFFETENENVSKMHLSVIYKTEDGWVATKDLSVMASGVERLSFEDLDGDGRQEIIVGWSVYSGVDKQLAVYSFSGETLSHLMLEKYTEYITCDLNTDQKKEIFLINQQTAEKKADAHLYGMQNGEMTEISGCRSDGGVTGYLQIKEEKLLGGRAAILIDASRGSSIITEVFFLENGALLNPLFDSASGKTLITERQGIEATDINGDGITDIPVTEIMPGYESAEESGRIYITRWCSFDGKQLNITTSAVMNYQDGYYFTLPKNLDGKITVVKNLETRLRTVFLYDKNAKMQTDELFRIQVLSPAEYTPEKVSQGWVRLYENDEKIIAVLISGYKGENAVTLEEISNMFKMIER